MQASTWVAVLALASLSIFSTLMGVALAKWAGDRPAAQATGIGFSVGIMVTIAVVELLPTAARESDLTRSGLAALAGIGVVAGLDAAFPHIHLVDENRGFGAGAIRPAWLVAFGLILHDFPEGFAMANAFIVDRELGVLVAIAILLHNIPEEFVIALPAVMTGSRRFLSRAALISASAEPAGALIGLVGVSAFPAINADLLAFAAGAMLFVSFHELVPLMRRLDHQRHAVAGITSGLLTVLSLGLLTGS